MDEQRIRACLSFESNDCLKHLTLLDSVDSTNECLLQLPASDRHAHSVLAEQQTAGRGRRGRRWQSPPGGNIYLSFGWNFSAVPESLPCLSLAVGVAVARGLEQLGSKSIGLQELGLKWPNDIQVGGRKMGGLLLESRPLPGGISVVAGIGLNVAMSAESPAAREIDQPWTSVTRWLGVSADDPGAMPLRDLATGHVLQHLIACFQQFQANGFESFRGDWVRLDVLRGNQVQVNLADRETEGLAKGIDLHGDLMLEETLPGGEKRIHAIKAGEVSVRMAQARADQ